MPVHRQNVHRSAREPRTQELIDRVAEARERGLIETGSAEVERTGTEELRELQRHAQELREQPGSAKSVSVTLRMPVATVDALRLRAKRLGVRGYQTLMKEWIEDRLRADDPISRAEVERALQPLVHLAQASWSHRFAHDEATYDDLFLEIDVTNPDEAAVHAGSDPQHEELER